MTLREYLDANALSQSDCAEGLGVSPAEVSLWLSGARHPNLENATKIEAWTDGRVKAASWIRKRRPSKGRRSAPGRAHARAVHRGNPTK